MAEEKIPDRFTRSVSLAGGMQDDVPEFLQEFPTLAYVENGRFRKTNEVEKTLPESDITPGYSSGRPLPPPNGPPQGASLAVESAGDTLLVVGTEEIREYSTTTGWRALSGSGNIIATQEEVCSTSQASGAMHYDWAESTIGDSFYVTAYETRVSQASNSSDFFVFVEAYTPDGVLLFKESVYGGSSPRVNQTIDGRVVVHYVKTAFGGGADLFAFDTSTKTHAEVFRNGGLSRINVSDDHIVLNAISAATSNVEWTRDDSSQQPVDGSYNPIRAGFSRNGNGRWYQVYYGTLVGYLIYSDGDDNNAIRIVRLAVNGEATVLPAERLIVSGKASTEDTQFFPLDITLSGVGEDEVWALVAERDAGAEISKLTLSVLETDLTGVVPSYQVANGNYTFSNGAIKQSFTGGGVWLAYTQVAGDETYLEDTPSGLCSLQVAYVASGGAVDPVTEIKHHRLTSSIVSDDNGPTFCTEQFGFFEPSQKNPNGDGSINAVNPPLPGLKPTTNILVNIEVETVAGHPVSGTVNPIATFDANTSKHTNMSMQEQNIVLGNLRKDGDDYLYINRQLLQGEDFSFWVQNRTNYSDDARKNWYFGDYRGNLYRVNTSPEKIQATKFGDSVILNTAIPLWYSGGDLFEMSVLEQPEIRYLDTYPSADARAWNYVEVIQASPDQWSLYQIVMGYVDSTGQMHRSAPSIPLYAWATRHAGEDALTNDTRRRLGFTSPVTSGDRSNYFIEVYAAKEGDVPALAYSAPLTEVNYVIFQDQYNLWTDAAPGASVKQYDPVRTSEIVYTNAGVLPADPWPTFDHAVVTSRRMFAIQQSTLYFSKLFEENIAPEMSAVLSIPFGRGRKLTAIGKIDDKVIVFEKDVIHAVYGDGPDNTGAGQAFIVDHLQTTMGCIDPESVIEIPEGLLFYSANTQEFHLIDRDLNIQDIGKAVQDLSVDIDIKAAVLFPAEHEVRWYVTGGPTEEFGPDPDEPPTRPPRPRYTNVLPTNPVLVLNYHYNKWTVLSEQPAVSATLFENDVVRVDDSWNVFRTSLDWVRSKLMKYRTPWARVQDLQSFGRVREVIMLGKYLSAWKDNGYGQESGDVKLTCKYNYEVDGKTTEYRWRANQDMKPSDGDRLQLSARPGQPKCQAMQLEIEEIPTEKLDDNEPNYTNGRGFVLSGLDLLYSLKRGLGSKSLGRNRRK